jgi:ribosomal protein S6--L-glutamate ligase
VNNSKLVQMYKLFNSGLLIPKTYYFGSWLPAREPKFPLVAKRIFGSGGEGVSLVKSKTAFKKIIKGEDGLGYIFQEYIENDFDWRIVVIGGRAVYSCMRVREQGADFRNNVKLGAKEVVARATPQVGRLAVKAARSMGLTVAGVDIIEHKNRDYIIEVNRAPSFTTNTKISREIPALAEYIKKCTAKK